MVTAEIYTPDPALWQNMRTDILALEKKAFGEKALEDARQGSRCSSGYGSKNFSHMKKALRAADVRKFTDIPNIGPSMTADFKLIGISEPANLKGKDPWVLFEKLCDKTHSRHDLCVLDTFMAAVDFMNGAPARPWWHYTPERKKAFRHPSSR